jgi:hypothetical protein
MFIALAAATAPALSDPMAPGYAAFERGHYSTAARALFFTTEINESIPESLYYAVAR